jgi:hypothetical protein
MPVLGREVFTQIPGQSHSLWDEAIASLLPPNFIRVTSLAELRELDGSRSSVVVALGFHEADDGGGGIFWLDHGDRTSADNGGTTIVGQGGKRWQRVCADLTPEYFGAVSQDPLKNTEAIQAALACTAARGGGIVRLQAKTYPVTQIVWGENGRGLHRVQLVGVGMGATVLQQMPVAGNERVGYGIRLVDSTSCVIRGLSIDSSRVILEGGMRSFCCQDLLIEDVEVRGGDYQSFVVSGPQFGLGTLKSERVTLRHCRASGQRTWPGDGKAAACFIAANAASHTVFDHCHVNGGRGDYFGNDYAFETKFIACVANNSDGKGAAGFWIEGGENPVHGASLIDCSCIKTQGGVGTSENARAIAINCRFKDISYGWAAWSRNGGLRLENCIFDNCCQVASETTSGGIVAEGKVVAIGCRFINSGSGSANVNVYSGGPPEKSSQIILSNCIFDLPVFVYGSGGPSSILIEQCQFLRKAQLRSYNAGGKTIVARSNRFFNKAVVIGGDGVFRIEKNTIHAERNYDGSALEVTFGSPVVVVKNNTISGFHQAISDRGTGRRDISNNRAY